MFHDVQGGHSSSGQNSANCTEMHCFHGSIVVAIKTIKLKQCLNVEDAACVCVGGVIGCVFI